MIKQVNDNYNCNDYISNENNLATTTYRRRSSLGPFLRAWLGPLAREVVGVELSTSSAVLVPWDTLQQTLQSGKKMGHRLFFVLKHLLINAYINNYHQHITINKCFIGFPKKEAFNCRDYNIAFKILLCYKFSFYYYVN